MTIENVFEIGDQVFLKHDADQLMRMVTSIIVYSETDLLYNLRCGSHSSAHYDYEIASKKDYRM